MAGGSSSFPAKQGIANTPVAPDSPAGELIDPTSGEMIPSTGLDHVLKGDGAGGWVVGAAPTGAPANHAGSHQDGGADEVATATPAANAIPKADPSGTLNAAWVPDGADGTAIHDNVAGEITGVTEKAVPVVADVLLIEDSADSNNKKRVQLGNLPTGGPPTTHALGGAEHSTSTLAQLNAKVSDATLIDTGDARLSDARTPTTHGLAGAEHSTSTLAQLNTKVSDATLIDTGDSRLSDARTPTTHGLGGAEHGTATLAQLNAKVSDATLIDTGDSRLSDARAPTGAAGGDLGGTYPNPTVNDGADGTAIHDNTAGEIAAVLEKANPVSADLFLIEDSAAANAKKRVQIGNLPVVPPASHHATNATFSTTSSTPVPVTGLTFTPAAGTWLVIFSGSGFPLSNSSTQLMGIYKAGVLVANSESDVASGGGQTAGMSDGFCSTAKITVNGAEVVDARLTASGGGFTADLQNTQLALIQVAA